MLIPSESDFETSVQKLVEEGFRPAPWTYGKLGPDSPSGSEDSSIGSETIRCRDPMRWHEYEMLDDNSVRFLFPEGNSRAETVVLLRSAYVGLSPPPPHSQADTSSSTQRFYCEENYYFPDKALLMESFIKTLLQEDSPSSWRLLLTCWTISYMYGLKDVKDTVLDTCDDETVKKWFNEKIRRGKGGIDKTTVSKRVGKGVLPKSL